MTHARGLSDCHGLRVGYAGVRVRVGLIRPSPYPYPWRGFRGLPVPVKLIAGF